jgi:hypothetical protein
MNTLLKNDECKTVFYAIIVAFLFFFIIMPLIESSYNSDNMKVKEELENLTNDVTTKIDLNKCARSCCLNSNWPVPKELIPNDVNPEELNQYVPTNFSCNLGNNTGCPCVKKSELDYLTSKGQNGY